MDRSRRCIFDWFRKKGWRPFPFQKETWDSYLRGESGLVHAPTGVGKTYAVWMGPILEWLSDGRIQSIKAKQKHEPLRVLWITPLRALASDTLEALREPIADLALPWTVELRTGDTSASARRKQREQLPTALITTPESLSLLLSYSDSREKFASLRCVIVDEWHELLTSKRGTQTELCLARLRRLQPALRIWGLSATLGNLDQAMEVLTGKSDGTLIHCLKEKRVQFKTVLPKSIDCFPWSGHLGLRLLPQVVQHVESANATLLFTNTRSQAEIWYQALLEKRPDWAGLLAVHHGSMDREIRTWVEGRLREGKLKCTVCTSSMDLGVDFTPVDQVIQIGSPKGVARLIQRAGRSGHQPGAASKMVCVPTNTFEILEFSAVRHAMKQRVIENRIPLEKPLDVLVQHLVTMALGGGFCPREMLQEVRSAYSYRHLSEEEWRWALDFLHHGGDTLRAYPQYAKITQEEGLFTVTSREITRLHRMSIGTITSESTLSVVMISGRHLGTIEEYFVSRLKPGEHFLFAGRVLELVMIHDMKVIVKPSNASRRSVPRWMGGNMSISGSLADAVQHQLQEMSREQFPDGETKAIGPVMALQAKWSRIPRRDELLIESIHLTDGYHIFFYPFAGRWIHEGIGALVAYRLSQAGPCTISVVANDYGFGFLSPTPFQHNEKDWRLFFSEKNLLEDIRTCINSTEMAKRQFREIARISGLVFSGYPGQPKTTRQIQASTGLLFNVFLRYDPGNLLLEQAHREVLEKQFELQRMKYVLEKMQNRKMILVSPKYLTPMAFPLWSERIRAQVSSESWTDRIQRMAMRLDQAAAESTKKQKSHVVHKRSERDTAAVA